MLAFHLYTVISNPVFVGRPIFVLGKDKCCTYALQEHVLREINIAQTNIRKCNMVCWGKHYILEVQLMRTPYVCACVVVVAE